MLTSNNSKTALIPSSDASVVTSSNVDKYEVNGTTTTTSGVTTIEYTSITPGTYVIVTFGSYQAKVTIIKKSCSFPFVPENLEGLEVYRKVKAEIEKK